MGKWGAFVLSQLKLFFFLPLLFSKTNAAVELTAEPSPDTSMFSPLSLSCSSWMSSCCCGRRGAGSPGGPWGPGGPGGPGRPCCRGTFEGKNGLLQCSEWDLKACPNDQISIVEFWILEPHRSAGLKEFVVDLEAHLSSNFVRNSSQNYQMRHSDNCGMGAQIIMKVMKVQEMSLHSGRKGQLNAQGKSERSDFSFSH